MNNATPGCVKDEVEGCGKGEECEEMKGFVGLLWNIGGCGFWRGG